VVETVEDKLKQARLEEQQRRNRILAADEELRLRALAQDAALNFFEALDQRYSVRLRERFKRALCVAFPRFGATRDAGRSGKAHPAEVWSVRSAAQELSPVQFAEAMGRSRAEVQRHLAAQTEATEASPADAEPAIPAPQGVLPCSCPSCGAPLQVSVGVSVAANSGGVSRA